MGNDDADAMAALISSKTGINAKANAAAVDLKPSATATGKGIELQIGANEGQTMNFTLDDMSADALGVAGNSVNLSTQESAQKATTAIDAAIKKVSASRGKMGAVQNRLEHTINNLDTASENMQTAESRIRDTDMAEEMVNYSKNNILAQACKGTTFFLICKYFAIFFSLFCIFFATALWLVVHRLHGAIRITAFTRIAIVLYALEILKDTYTYPYCTEAYDCNNYNLL